MQPPMIPVSSSNLGSVGYDAEALELWIYFHTSNKTYSYSGVPPDVHEGLISAPSAGQYFHANIKHHYTCTKR